MSQQVICPVRLLESLRWRLRFYNDMVVMLIFHLLIDVKHSIYCVVSLQRMEISFVKYVSMMAQSVFL